MVEPCYTSELGQLYASDCLVVLPQLVSESVECVFADPPFNISKQYGQSCDDNMPEKQYEIWCRAWLAECIRVLKPGGSLWLYHIPKWGIKLGAWLIEQGLELRHCITVEQKNGMPISGRLFPSAYHLLYLTKGKPATFHKIRTPIETCRHCGGEIKDYGGHRGALHPDGINLKDVWTDITPVRHQKYKSKDRQANALSTKILDRVVEISTNPGDVVLDPFGGSGTTFAVCESKGRRWVGIEIDFCDAIVDRLVSKTVEPHQNTDIVEAV